MYLSFVERRIRMSKDLRPSIFHFLKNTIGIFKYTKIIVFVFFVLLPIMAATYDYYSNPYINHNLIDLQNIGFMISNLLISVVIILFFLVSSLYIKHMNDLKTAFYYINPSPKYSYSGIFNRTLECLRLGSKEGKIIAVKIFYCVVWLFISYKFIEYVINIYLQHKENSALKYTASMNLAVLLYGVAFILLGFSVFGTFVWLIFFYKISCSNYHVHLEKYEYNEITPVNTYGFRKLISFINLNVICFFVSSILLIGAFCIHIFSSNNNQDLCNLHNNIFLFVFLLYFLLGIIGSVLAFVLPTICIKRIITVWTDHSARRYTSTIHRYKQLGYPESMIDRYEQKLQTLYSNRSIFKFDIVSFFLTIITLLATIAPVFISLIK